MAKRKRKKGKKKKSKLGKALAGSRRRSHFASGGDLAGWLPQQRKIGNKKKAALKKKCRGRIKQEG